MLQNYFLLAVIGLLMYSSKAAGESCRGLCGSKLAGCSCHSTCESFKNCCLDYNQSCFEVRPYSSSMLGGTPLKIINLILLPNDQLRCRFKGEIATRGIIDSEGQAFCISPLLYEIGWIQVDISIDGSDFDRTGEYLSVHPSKADPSSEVVLVNGTKWHNYGSQNISGELEMTWNQSRIGADTVNIELWGYEEINTGTAGTNETLSYEASIHYLYSIGTNVPNTGLFSFFPESSQNYSDIELGNIRITANSVLNGARDVPALWSRGHVLAWHLEEAFRQDSAAWAKGKCLQWDALEKTLPNFLNELTDCPCTLAQARADTGRFHTDYSCNIETGSVCTYHPGCVHCVRSVQASPTYGAGQQCCYDHSGNLVLTGDSAGGSTPDKAHDWGAPPYGKPPRVPGYSHWLYDVMSFFYCCVWSDSCPIYLKNRPSSGCRRYQPPHAAVVLGDPHFITFDGFNYTFNGEGEYSLVLSPHNELHIQARTEKVKLQNGSSAYATQLSSVAMREASSDTVEVRQMQNHLQVLRNQKILPLNEQTWMVLHGLFVFTPSPQYVRVMFSCGVGVEVRLNEEMMAATVLLPLVFANQTKGLLGVMNSDPSDDLMTPSGEVLSSASLTPENIFKFGEDWKISQTSSLFTYDSSYLLETYHSPAADRPAFVPVLSPPEDPGDPLVTSMRTLCSGDGAHFCEYDTLLTRSLAVGNTTLRALHRHLELVKDLKPVSSCGWLPTPKNGRKNGTHYLKGDRLSFTCDPGYGLYGSTECMCLEEGTWTGQRPNCISDNPLSFILGAIGFSSVLITMGVMIHQHIRKQERERKSELDQITEAQGQP
ncbi:sushi domain-containing protein 2 [Periophthalmus magnuspinnatus]|uniref:sushi domain-containing protein 2 n=1 Tax=Periophthalmus magnuspinnatus TaxID=409849 RepID=UPI00243635DE|nr:sushi domain-containing protein 2 [Periophthalmus magnuspinnatus]